MARPVRARSQPSGHLLGSFRSRLVLGALLLVAASIAAALAATQLLASEVVGEQIDERAVLLSRSLARSARGAVEESTNTVEAFAGVVERSGHDSVSLDHLVENFRATNPTVIREVHVVDRVGRLVASSRLIGRGGNRFVSLDAVLDPASRTNAHLALTEARLTGTAISDVAVPTLPSQVPVIYIARTYEGGAVLAEIDLRQLWPIVDSLQLGETGDAYLVSGSGRVLSHPDRERTGSLAAERIQAAIGREGIVTRDDPDGALRSAVSPLGGRTDWLAVVEQRRDEARTPVARLATGALLVFALSLLVAGPLLALLASTITRPLRLLAETANRATAGLATFTPASPRSPREVRELASSLAFMSSEVGAANAALQRQLTSAERARSLTESISRAADFDELISALDEVMIRSTGAADHVALVTFDSESQVRVGPPPPGWSILSAVATTDLAGATPWTGLPLGRDVVPADVVESEAIRTTLDDRDLAHVLPLWVEAGEVLVALVLIGWIDRPRAEQVDMVALVSDVLIARIRRYYLRDRLQQYSYELEDRVRARTAEIEQASSELEAFTATVSHDLKGPLQAIRSFADLAELRLDRGEIDSARAAVSRIATSAGEMATFTTRLLAVTSIGHAGLVREVVDLTELAEAAADGQCELFGAPRSAVTIEPLGSADVDRTLVRATFENLLSNAIKYTGADHRLEVRISRTIERGAITYCVADRGVGIEPDLLPKVFEMYLRSATRSESGDGVGLASAKRIVLAHGGSIWAENGPDGGTVFKFTLGRVDLDTALPGEGEPQAGGAVDTGCDATEAGSVGR